MGRHRRYVTCTQRASPGAGSDKNIYIYITRKLIKRLGRAVTARADTALSFQRVTRLFPSVVARERRESNREF